MQRCLPSAPSICALVRHGVYARARHGRCRTADRAGAAQARLGPLHYAVVFFLSQAQKLDPGAP